MGGDLELGPFADSLDRPLKLRVGERHQPPTADADHVVVMSARIVALKGNNLAAHVDPVNQLQLLQLLERPVHARPPDTRQPPINLQRRNRTALAPKQLNHLQPRRPSPEARLVEAISCLVCPGHADNLHENETRSYL